MGRPPARKRRLTAFRTAGDYPIANARPILYSSSLDFPPRRTRLGPERGVRRPRNQPRHRSARRLAVGHDRSASPTARPGHVGYATTLPWGAVTGEPMPSPGGSTDSKLPTPVGRTCQKRGGYGEPDRQPGSGLAVLMTKRENPDIRATPTWIRIPPNHDHRTQAGCRLGARRGTLIGASRPSPGPC